MYEVVEEIEVEYFLKKSIKKRDWYLYHTSPSELTCYFLFMNLSQFLQCFSKEAILDCFKNLPPDDLIVLCQEVTPEKIHLFLQPKQFREKWAGMKQAILVYEFSREADIIFKLVEHNYISYSDLYDPMPFLKISDLSHLYERHSCFSKLFQPLLEDMFITFHFMPPELVRIILSFLFQYKENYKKQIGFMS